MAGVTPGLNGSILTGSTAGTSATPSIPAGITTSHYMVMSCAIVGNKVGTLTGMTGWTKLGTELNNGTAETLVLYGRRYQAGDSNPTLGWTTSNRYLAVIDTYLGVDSSTPLDITVPTYTTGSSGSAASPAGTAATHGALRIHVVAKGATGASTPDARMTEIHDNTTTALALNVGYETDLANGNGGTRTSTHTSTTWVAATVILRPATPAPTGRLQSGGGHASSSGATTFTVTLPQNGTAGSTLIARAATWIGGTTGNKINDVDYNSGTNFSLLVEGIGPSNNQHISIWAYSNNAQTGSAPAVVARRGGGSDDITMWVEEWADLDTSTLLDQSVANSGTSSTASCTMPTMSSGNKLELNAIVSDQAGISATGDTDFLVDFFYNNTADVSMGAQHRQLSGGAGDTITWGIATGDWVSLGVALNVAAAGPGSNSITASATFVQMSGSSAVSESDTASASSSFSALASSASVTEQITVSASEILSTMSGASSVTEKDSITASQTLDSMSGSASGYAYTPVTAASTFDAMTSSASVSVNDTVSGSASLDPLSSSASVTVIDSATSASTFSDMAGSASATEANAASSSSQMADMQGSASVSSSDTAQGASTYSGTQGSASVGQSVIVSASSPFSGMSGTAGVSVSDQISVSATFDAMSNLGSLVDRARMTLETREWKALTSFPSGFEPREFSLVYSASDSMWYLFSTHPADSGTVMYSASTLEDLGAATPVTVSASSLWYPNAVKSGTTWYVFGTTGTGQSGFITSSSTPPGSWSAITNLRAGLFNLDLNDPSVVKINIGGTSYWLLAAITANATTPDGRLILRIYRHADPPSATGWTLLESGVEDIFQNIGVPSFASVNAFNPNIIALNGRYYMGFEGNDGSSTTTGLVEIDLHDSPPVGGYAVGEVVVLSSSSLGGTDWADITFIQCPDGVDRIFGASAQNLGALELYPDTAASSSVEASASSVFDSMVGTSSVSEAVEISASSTLQDMSGAALIEATAANEASASATFDAMQGSSSVQSRIDISASSPFSPLGGSSSVTEAISAIASATLDSMSGASEIVQIEGNGVSADITFSPMLGSSSVTNGVAAQSSSSLSPMVGTASAQSSDTAQGSATFSPTIASSAVASTVSAQGQATFSPMIGAASLAYAPNSVSASSTLDAMLGIASASLSVGIAASPTLSSMIGASSLALSVEAAFSELLEDMSASALMRFVAQATRAHGEISERSRFSGNITERDITGVTIEETSVLSIAFESALSTAGAIEASRYSGRATEE